MADPVIDAPAPAPISTPAPATPVAAEAAPAPVIATAAPVAPAEAAPTPVTPAPAAAPAASEPTSILSEAKPAASTEVAPPVSTPAEVAPAAPLPPPVFESFKLPEGVTLDEGKVTEFTKMLGDLEVTGKASHAEVQAFGQKAVDFFIAEQQRSQQALVDSFSQIREGWKQEIKADPVFGGNNFQATVGAAGALIEQYGGSAEEVAELRKVMRITGVGDNPHLIKFMARAGKALAQEGKPVPAVVPKSPTLVSKSARRYSGSLANGSGS